jgi:hypothetical protein
MPVAKLTDGRACVCVLLPAYFILHTVSCVLCTVYFLLCTVYCVVCAVCCVLCAVYCRTLAREVALSYPNGPVSNAVQFERVRQLIQTGMGGEVACLVFAVCVCLCVWCACVYVCVCVYPRVGWPSSTGRVKRSIEALSEAEERPDISFRVIGPFHALRRYGCRV